MIARAGRRMLRAVALGLALAAATSAVHAQRHVTVPSLDAPRGVPVMLPGFWFKAEPIPNDRAPAVLLLHGCGGPYGSTRRDPKPLATRMLDYARFFNALGVHVLIVDSLTPRDEKELCTQKIGTRRVTQRERRRDALGALRWLADQRGVDAARIGLVGWSNGASTVLAATDLQHAEVARESLRPAMAVAFYPGCAAWKSSGHAGTAPLLMLLGAADDWTPAQPCLDLAATSRARRPGTPTEAIAFAGAYHDFDSQQPIRVRSDVPNGVVPGAGVHSGGDEKARAAARERLAAFTREHLLPER